MKAKKLISAVTALVLVCGAPVFSFESPAFEANALTKLFDSGVYEGLFSYNIQGVVSDTPEETLLEDKYVMIIKKCEDADFQGKLVIPEEIDGVPVTYINVRAFEGSDFMEVIIPKSVTMISDNAFRYCPNLISVTIENPNCNISDNDQNAMMPLFGSTFSPIKGKIYGYADSTAQKYAEYHGLDFDLIENKPYKDENIIYMKTGETRNISTADGLKWAVDDSDILKVDYLGTVTAKTAGTAVVYAISGDTVKNRFIVNVSGNVISPIDINKDGQINPSDASDILRYYAYLSTGGKLSFEEFTNKE